MASEEAIGANLNEARIRESAWGGGVSPFAIGSNKLGMWLFIISDAITFSTLLICYTYVRVASEAWPRPFPLWPSIAKATLMTVVFLSSSLTMVLGVRAASAGSRGQAARWLLATMFGGIGFILLHAHEWLGLIKGAFDRHRRLARWTLSVWLYVSLTGVAVYWMLYHLWLPR